MPTKQTNLHILSLTLLAPIAATVTAQDVVTEMESPWVGVVTSDSTPIRCGANESYYIIATANVGDLVHIHGKRQDWMKIDTSGNVFLDTVGYIKYPASESSLMEITSTGGIVLGDLDVLAKNTESDELYRSWRPILRLQNNDPVRVIESIVTEPGTLHRESYVVHTVHMPNNGIGWVNASNITKATPEQIALFNNSNNIKTITPNNNVVVTQHTTSTEITNGDIVVDNSSLQPLSLVELEAAWDKIASEPVMGAEVLPLKDMYTELLVNNGDDIVIEQIAGGRIKQLNVWASLQSQRVRIDLLRANMVEQTEDMNDFQSIMSLYGEYAIAGRLALSNTFDGRLRPFMYRIQDVKSGRTLGYLPLSDDLDLSGLLGQTVGVVGKRSWNPNWRVTVVDAARFDILSPTTATVTPDIQ